MTVFTDEQKLPPKSSCTGVQCIKFVCNLCFVM